MASDYYYIKADDRKAMHKAAKELQEAAWSDHCDLDYWIQDMSKGSQHIPNNVLKMAMKHLSRDLYNISGFLARIEEANYEHPNGR